MPNVQGGRYETQYDWMGRPIGTHWVNPGESLDQAIVRAEQEAGFAAIRPDDPSLSNPSIAPRQGVQPMPSPQVRQPHVRRMDADSVHLGPRDPNAGGAGDPFTPSPMGDFIRGGAENPYTLQNTGSGTPPAGPTGGARSYPRALQVRMPDGSIQSFNAMDSAMAEALTAGGIPLDPRTQQPMTVTPDVYGGYLLNGLPINIIMGGDWLPGQRQALTNYYAAGWQPGDPPLPNPPALPPEAAVHDPGRPPGDHSEPGAVDFGYLSETFEEPFQFDPQQIESDPGYQFRMGEGLKALERSGAARGTLNSGRTLKEITRFGQGLASDEFSNAWNRRMSEYGQRRDVFRTNRSDLFNRYASLADIGQTAAGTTANYANIFGANAGQLNLAGGDVAAAGRVASGNAYRDFYTKTGELASPYLLRVGAR